MRLRTLASALALVTILPLFAAAPASAGAHQRFYLLGSSTDYLRWSVDPADPELDQRTIVRACSVTGTWGVPDSKPCLGGVSSNGRSFQHLFFDPGTQLLENLTWTTAAPLTYHFELDVDQAPDAVISLVLQVDGGTLESAPATQVAPGVYEGSLKPGYTIKPSDTLFFGIRVETRLPHAVMRLKARGSSWIESPVAVQAKSVPELIADDTYRPAASSFAGDLRELTFNDTNWTAASFSGTSGTTRDFPVAIPKDAVSVIAWAEMYEDPFVREARRLSDPDPRNGIDGISVTLQRGTTRLATSNGPYYAQGHSAAVALDVTAGPLTLRVTGSDRTGDPLPYRAFVVAIQGPKTLASMRWTTGVDYALRVPGTASCPWGQEQMPVTDNVATFIVDLDWDGETLGHGGWTLGYTIPKVGDAPCSEGGTGDQVRFTLPANKDVWAIGPTPAYDRTFVSAFDTAFELEVRYTYR